MRDSMTSLSSMTRMCLRVRFTPVVALIAPGALVALCDEDDDVYDVTAEDGADGT